MDTKPLNRGDNEDVRYQCRFISRLQRVPLIESSKARLGETYGRLKNSNPSLFQLAENVARIGLRMILFRAMPVFQKFQEPISTLDSWACQILDKIPHTSSFDRPTRKNDWNAGESSHFFSFPLANLVLRLAEFYLVVGRMLIDLIVPPVSDGDKVDEEEPMETSRLIRTMRRGLGLVTLIPRRLAQRVHKSVGKLLFDEPTGIKLDKRQKAQDEHKTEIKRVPESISPSKTSTSPPLVQCVSPKRVPVANTNSLFRSGELMTGTCPFNQKTECSRVAKTRLGSPWMGTLPVKMYSERSRIKTGGLAIRAAVQSPNPDVPGDPSGTWRARKCSGRPCFTVRLYPHQVPFSPL